MKYLLEIIFEYLFGCHHGNLSRVFTIQKHSYRVCCDCGKSFEYSLKTMSICRTHPAGNPALQTDLRARTA
jgi:hypothetical protein